MSLSYIIILITTVVFSYILGVRSFGINNLLFEWRFWVASLSAIVFWIIVSNILGRGQTVPIYDDKNLEEIQRINRENSEMVERSKEFRKINEGKERS